MLELVCVVHLVLALEMLRQIAVMLLMINVNAEKIQHAQWLKKHVIPEHVSVEQRLRVLDKQLDLIATRLTTFASAHQR